MTAIEFEHISKQYHLGKIGTGTLSKDLNRWWAAVRGKEDPYLKIGQINNRASKAEGDFVWALRDINFKVEQGEVVGIIGKNGSGKSTLLKILSKVTSPTTGRIRGRGRVASLLEVGTGFHPEMTGRENIYMNGAIMGMTKAEIDRKLDEIVDFAGVAMYVDTPVKRYSSGMMVRLGFAVAAHLEPEILVVDEVLAVGDAEFQKKAIGKMQEVASGYGRTVLFVSHNMGAVRNLCTRGIVLDRGQKIFEGNINKAIDLYINHNPFVNSQKIIDAIIFCQDYLHIDYISFNGTIFSETTIVSNQSTVDLVIKGHTNKPIDAEPKLIFKNISGVPLMAYAEGRNTGKCDKLNGDFIISRTIILPSYLAKGELVLDVILHMPQIMDYARFENCIKVQTEGNFLTYGHPLILHEFGVVGLKSKK